MKDDNEFEKDAAGTGFQEPPQPIVPGRSPIENLGHEGSQQLQRNHAELVLVLGIISLFMCGPLGVAAWVLGASELKKIRRGEMSSEKVGILRFGRTLGIVGTVIFVISIALAVFLWKQGLTTFGDMLKVEPLPPDQIVFAGEWLGERGTAISIRPDGTADFRSRHSSVIGGRVKIQGDALTIGILGFASTWHIDSKPHLEDGHWIMKLDGENFARRVEGLLVLALCP
jgi:hypothetical protein